MSSQTLMERIEEAGKQSAGAKSKSARFEQAKWTRTSCEDHAAKFKFRTAILQFDEQRAIMIRFINFYVNGSVSEGHTTKAIVIDMASLLAEEDAKDAASLFWMKDWMAGEGEASELHGVPKTRTRGIIPNLNQAPNPLDLTKEVSPLTKISTPLDGQDSSKPPAFSQAGGQPPQESPTSLLKTYTSTDLTKFLRSCTQVLDSTPASSTPGKAFYQLRMLLNYLALTFLRFVTKDEHQMAQAFSKNLYQKNIANLIFQDDNIFYSPPCRSALNKAAISLTKKNRDISSLMAKLVSSWVKSSEGSQEGISARLAAAVLTHTAYNGMGIIEMISQITDQYKVSWVEIARYTLNQRTFRSWELISHFFVEYIPISNPDQTYPWARVIHDGYFTEFRTVSHSTLASILAPSIAASQDDQGIYDANWAIKRKATVDDLRPIGEVLLRKLAGTADTQIGSTKEAREIILINPCTMSTR